MRVHVAFTPAEAAEAPTGLVVDVLRATSTIAQALSSGYGRILCCADVEEARALRGSDGSVVLGGERLCVRIPGFDRGNSPREFTDGDGETVVLTTTNGTRAIVAAAARCERVYAASLLNLEAVVAAARGDGEDVAIFCAGVEGELALDDAYTAGRLVEALGLDGTDAAAAAVRIARSFHSAYDGLAASRSARNLFDAGLDDDVAWCARESVLDVVPRLAGMRGSAAELVAEPPPAGVRRGGRAYRCGRLRRWSNVTSVSEKAEEQDRLDRDRERSTEAHWQAAEAGAEQEPEQETPKGHDAPVPKRDDDGDDERKLVQLEEEP